MVCRYSLSKIKITANCTEENTHIYIYIYDSWLKHKKRLIDINLIVLDGFLQYTHHNYDHKNTDRAEIFNSVRHKFTEISRTLIKI